MKTRKIPALLAALAMCLAMTAVHGQEDKTSYARQSERLSRHITAVARVAATLQEKYVDTVDVDSVLLLGLNYMLDRLDPYTVYAADNMAQDLLAVSTGQYSGMGCTITRRDSVIVMAEPRWDSPSRNQGVRHGDILLAIDGQALTPATSLSDVTKRLRGEAGTSVTLTLKRQWLPQGDSIFDLDVVRGPVVDEAVELAELLDGNIAYVALSTFNNNSARNVRHSLERLRDSAGGHLQGVIIDLRNNGGGIITGAVDLAALFVPKGSPVVSTRGRNTETREYKTDKRPLDTQLPLAVLVNNGSASASEIFAGAMQDLDRGVIVGRRSYGKGLVQSVEPMFDDLFKYTSAKYYLPSGRLIQALDYSKRNEDGSVMPTPDSLTNIYSTARGRQVRDGGGITPDTTVVSPKSSSLSYALWESNTYDNFANRYANSGLYPAPGVNDTIVTDSLYSEFKAFVNPAGLKYDRASEAGIKYIRDAAKYEGMDNPAVLEAIDRLEELLKHDLDHELDANRREIADDLDIYIAMRYLSPNDQGRRAIRDDNDIKAAVELLRDAPRYKKILNP